jgi:hypothetical protein
MGPRRPRTRSKTSGTLPLERVASHIDVNRLADIVARVQRGDPNPVDPAWLERLPPLSKAEQGRLKGAFASNRQLQPPLACMAPVQPPCEKKPIDSHSMQRGGPLSVLAEDDRVIVLRYSQSIVEPASTYAELTPIRSATIFPGLCETHDAQLFEPIERHSLRKPTAEQSFLLAYRAVLRTLYVARQMARQRQGDLEAMLQQPPGTTVLEMFVVSLLRMELVIPRLTQLTDEFARWHRAGMYAGLPTIVGRNLPVLPFAVCNYLEPRFDEEGRPIQRSDDLPPFIVLNVVPARDGSTVTLSFLEQHRRALDPLLAPLKASNHWKDFADRIWQIALRYGDNVVVAPAAWRKISEPRRQHILRFADDTRDEAFTPMLPGNMSLIEDA